MGTRAPRAWGTISKTAGLPKLGSGCEGKSGKGKHSIRFSEWCHNFCVSRDKGKNGLSSKNQSRLLLAGVVVEAQSQREMRTSVLAG